MRKSVNAVSKTVRGSVKEHHLHESAKEGGMCMLGESSLDLIPRLRRFVMSVAGLLVVVGAR